MKEVNIYRPVNWITVQTNPINHYVQTSLFCGEDKKVIASYKLYTK